MMFMRTAAALLLCLLVLFLSCTIHATPVEEATVTTDCAESGTCDASGMYKTGEQNDAIDDDEDEEEDEDDEDEGDDEEEERECADDHEDCEMWTEKGECEANPYYMLYNCRKSCKVCGEVEFDLGVEQAPCGSDYEEDCKERMEYARDYVANTVAKDPDIRHVIEGCLLHDEQCSFWAVAGECEDNPDYMNENCPAVCGTCDELSIEKRCPLDPETMPDAWKPGDLNEFFTNITKLESYKQYEPTVLSRPSYLPGDSEENANYKIGPWVVTLENVLSQEEADRMIELGAIEGYERSSDVGKMHFDGSYENDVNEGRTSHNAWCEEACYEDPVAQQVIEKVTNITNIPETNSEWLQLLRYEPGQFYHTHHDYIEHQWKRQCGVRVLTVFLYLNTVEEGGGTNFPELDITVMPKRGRALIWPSVLDEDPSEKDERTDHQALPVTKGIKYGANAWIHLRDYKSPALNDCE